MTTAALTGEWQVLTERDTARRVVDVLIIREVAHEDGGQVFIEVLQLEKGGNVVVREGERILKPTLTLPLKAYEALKDALTGD